MFNVKDFGAVRDGTTDDTAAIQAEIDDTVAIQAAIDAAETAGGGVVHFPDGTYLISGSKP